MITGEPLPSSLNPKPDSFPAALVERECVDIPTMFDQEQIDKARRKIARIVLDTFWLDMGYAHHSAVIQCSALHPMNSFYAEQARTIREHNETRRARELDVLESRVARQAA